MLVYPTVIAAGLFDHVDEPGGPQVETFVTITNAGAEEVYAHVSYINGYDESYECYECDFSIPLSGNDTETLVIAGGYGGIQIKSEDSDLELACDWPFGMLVVTLEPLGGNSGTDNVLIGSQVVVDYVNGAAYSIPAIPFQGLAGNGDRTYGLNDVEYGKMPRIVAADFLAPNLFDGSAAALALFTLGFDRQFPPLTDCSVTGYDAFENPFSASFQFGCWTAPSLCAISPEFCWPNLGLFSTVDTHGWLQLNCRVDSDADGTFDANGGVHGALIQFRPAGSTIEATLTDGSNELFVTGASWARLLHQSVTTGDAVTLTLENPGQGLD